MFTVSQKKSTNGLLLVITDSTILGKIFEEGKLQLDLTKDFYKGDEMGVEELKTLIHTARHIHFTGVEAINLAKELELIENKILVVDKVPHAEVFMGE